MRVNRRLNDFENAVDIIANKYSGVYAYEIWLDALFNFSF